MSRHSYQVGDKVTVMNSTMGGKQVVEGIAIVRKLLPLRDRYMVSFEGERQQYERFVAPPEVA